MKNQKSISVLVFFISILSIVATSYAIISNQGSGEFKFKSIFGETITIYGKGLYKHDSVSMAAQAIAQDYVTLFLGVPLLNPFTVFVGKRTVKGASAPYRNVGIFLIYLCLLVCQH